jgi:hypothetical protein
MVEAVTLTRAEEIHLRGVLSSSTTVVATTTGSTTLTPAPTTSSTLSSAPTLASGPVTDEEDQEVNGQNQPESRCVNPEQNKS